MASVSLESVSKVFAGQVTAVRDLNLQVRDEEFLVLLGPSGCGKSTTLRMIAGLEEVTYGRISIGGHIVNDVAPKDRNIAMVFQNYALYPHLSVYRNMSFGLELRYGGGYLQRIWKRLTSPADAAKLAAKRRGIRDEVRQTAQVLRIEQLLDRMPGQLSGGERQRVALGRAIVRQPAVFLFDEPLSSLDAKLRLETRRELKEIHRKLSTTMIYVTHDQTEAMTLGDRIVVMDGGEIQQIGTSREIYDHPRTRFVAGFLGSPPMNFVTGQIVAQGGIWFFAADGLQVALHENLARCLLDRIDDDRRVVLGIRPEDIVVEAGRLGFCENCGEVTLVESLGDCTLLHVRMTPESGDRHGQPERLICKVEPRTCFGPGDRVRLRLTAERMHMFDPVGGENLLPPLG